jgi:hypothetical protein
LQCSPETCLTAAILHPEAAEPAPAIITTWATPPVIDPNDILNGVVRRDQFCSSLTVAANFGVRGHDFALQAAISNETTREIVHLVSGAELTLY